MAFASWATCRFTSRRIARTCGRSPDMFELNPDGTPHVIAGVPPDYFSATGQCWGNPIYNWEKHAQTGFQWWIARFRRAFEMLDMIRLDHFRGFEAYYEIPGTRNHGGERSLGERSRGSVVRGS